MGDEKNKQMQEAADNLDDLLGLERIWTRPISYVKKIGDEYFIVYDLNMKIRNNDTSLPDDFGQKLGKAIDDALAKHPPLTADSLVYFHNKTPDGKLLFGFPYKEIEKRNQDGTYFDRLEAARKDIWTAVETLSKEAYRPQREEQAKRDGYATRLSEILGVRATHSSMFESRYIRLDIYASGNRATEETLSDALIDKLVPIRNVAGLTAETCPLSISEVTGQVQFPIKAIESAPDGPEAFFKKLETVQDQLQKLLREEREKREEDYRKKHPNARPQAELGLPEKAQALVNQTGKDLLAYAQDANTLSTTDAMKLAPAGKSAEIG